MYAGKRRNTIAELYLLTRLRTYTITLTIIIGVSTCFKKTSQPRFEV